MYPVGCLPPWVQKKSKMKKINSQATQCAAVTVVTYSSSNRSRYCLVKWFGTFPTYHIAVRGQCYWRSRVCHLHAKEKWSNVFINITSWTALRNLSYGNFAPQRNMCPCSEWRHVLILATYDMTTYWFDSPSNNWTPAQCWAKSSFIPEKKQISNGVLCASKAFLFLTQLKQFWNAVIFCVVHPVISKADPKALRTYRNCQAVVLFSTSCSLRLRVQPHFGVQPLTSTLQDLASLPPSLRHSWPLASLPPSCKPPWLGPALEGYHIHLQVGPEDVFLLPFRPLGSWWAWLLASWKPIHVEVWDWPLSWPLPWKL